MRKLSGPNLKRLAATEVDYHTSWLVLSVTLVFVIAVLLCTDLITEGEYWGACITTFVVLAAALLRRDRREIAASDQELSRE